MLVTASKTAISNISVTQRIRPMQFWKQLKSSSRAGESSSFNISKKMKKRTNACLRLQFFEDVSCENAVFDCSSNVFFAVFQSILGRLEGTGKLPRSPWSQIGNIELPGVIQGCPGAHTGRQQKNKNHLNKNKVFRKLARKQVFRCERVNIFKTRLPCW